MCTMVVYVCVCTGKGESVCRITDLFVLCCYSYISPVLANVKEDTITDFCVYFCTSLFIVFIKGVSPPGGDVEWDTIGHAYWCGRHRAPYQK